MGPVGSVLPGVYEKKTLKEPNCQGGKRSNCYLANAWGDSDCQRWVNDVPSRCSAVNYQAKCAKACCPIWGEGNCCSNERGCFGGDEEGGRGTCDEELGGEVKLREGHKRAAPRRVP